MARAQSVEARVDLSLNDRLTSGLKRIQSRMNRLGRSAGLDRLGKATSGLGRSLGNLGGAAGRVTGRLSGLTAIMGLGGGGLVAAAIGVTSKVQSLGDEIGKTSRQMGLGVEALQEWRYAADRQGVSVGTLDSSLKILNRRMGEAANGNKSYAKYFADLGVSITDSQGNLRDMDAVLMDVTAAMSEIESPAERAAVAMGIFGRSGMDMTKVFEAGTDAVKGLREEAQRLGYVLTDQDTQLAEKYTDNLTNFHRRLEGLRLEIGVKLMPMMNSLVTRFGDWFDANRKLISSQIGAWVQRLKGFIEDLLDPTSEIRRSMANFADSLSGVWRSMQPVVDILGAGKTAALALGLYIGGPLIAAVAALVPAVVSLGVALMTTPIGWILGGLVAIGGATYVLVKRWDDFTDYWSGLWGRVTTAFQSGWVNGILAALAEFNPVTHIARGINAVVEYFSGVDLGKVGGRLVDRLGRGMRRAFRGVMRTLGRALRGIGDRIKRARIGQWGAFMIDKLRAGVSTALGSFLSFWRERWGRVSSAFDQSWSAGILTTLREFNPTSLILGGMSKLVKYFTGIDLSAKGTELIRKLETGITEKWAVVVKWATGLKKTIKGWFKIDLMQVGRDIVASLEKGITERWETLKNTVATKISELGQMLPGWAKDMLGIKVEVDTSAISDAATVASRIALQSPPAPDMTAPGMRKVPEANISVGAYTSPLGTPSYMDRVMGRQPAFAPDIHVVPAAVPSPVVNVAPAKSPEIRFDPPPAPVVQMAAQAPAAPRSLDLADMVAARNPIREKVEATTMEAGSVRTGHIESSEPLFAKMDQNIQHSMSVTNNITVAPGMGEADVRRAVDNAMKRSERRQLGDLRSSLRDLE